MRACNVYEDLVLHKEKVEWLCGFYSEWLNSGIRISAKEYHDRVKKILPQLFNIDDSDFTLQLKCEDGDMFISFYGGVDGDKVHVDIEY